MKSESCVFCKIINKEIPVTSVFEDEDLIVIKDRDPKAPVHLLIIPKKHVANLDEITHETSGILVKILLRAKQLAEENNTSGKYKIVTNVGELAGQTVFHMHFHLLGGWESKEQVESQLKQI
jgi:histidine triad (HIT) family protein